MRYRKLFEKAALDLTSPDQLDSAKTLYALLGGTLGAGGGALLGRYLGGMGAETLGMEEEAAKNLGSGLGVLGGGVLGGLSGYHLAKMLHGAPPALRQEAQSVGIYPPQDYNYDMPMYDF